ncbi:putative Transcription elongation factor SPT5 [Seiridium unicorne]|uniref:Transcription elongation factor SPT5 n=1 Tax=Seiridium unicorne TaxID=138068 RepID=A0ABR2VGM8_9PEZI
MSDPRDHDQRDDSEDEEDFNPAPEVGSDGEENNDDNQNDEDEAPRRESKRASPARSAGGDDEGDNDEDDEGEGEDLNGKDDDDDDEEDDEDDDDEEDEIQGHRRKRRRNKTNAFLDIYAEVDDEDEGEEEDEDAEDQEGFIDREEAGEADIAGRDDDTRHRELDRRRDLEASFDAEKQAEIYQKRYGNRKPARGMGDSGGVPQRLLLPSVDDPSIWGVRCKEGKEREVVFSIMKRVEERLGTKDELGITAAFERGGPNSVMKGLIYVEAPRQNDVLQALDGMLNVYPRTKLLLVDIKEMPDLLRVQKTPTLEPGSWVRLRRPPKHAGDLAQVLDITQNGLEARVRFIPRLDYGVRDDPGAAMTADGKRKRPAFGVGPRPPQKLFSEVEARKRNPRALTGNPTTNTWTYNGDEFEQGFQVKDIKIQLLTVQDVNPTLEEVTRFASGGEDGVENIDLKSLAASLKDSSANVTYLPGDVIEVYDGEQKGVFGRATNVQGDIVTIDVTEGDLAGQTIEVPTKGLRKRFRPGDHVKVIGGSRYRDEVGMVVKISEDRVTLLTDQSHTEITVFSKDLREASDIGGQGSLGQYEMLDLVELDPTTVGCIVKVDRESMVVLDQNGDNRQVLPSQIANKLPKRKMAVAADRNGAEIRLDDVVKESGGMGRQGKIIHIHRTYVFCHTNTTNENAGIFVSRVSNISTISAKGGRNNAKSSMPDLTSMNPALKRNLNGSGMAPPPKPTIGRDRLVGQTVTIRKGGYKGLLGRVKETSDTHARVELHTKSKVINIPKQDLIVKDPVTGREIKNYDSRRPPGAGAPRFDGGGRPGGDWNNGSRTPMASSMSNRTPAWKTPSSGGMGGRTPAWNKGGGDFGGSRTPAWAGADGSRTVNPYDGSRTAYGSGSRTPAWNSGSKTPAPDGFSHGSKTPAYGSSGASDPWSSGSKTPYGAAAPTPGASGGDTWGYTPGASGASGAYDAPTPGGMLGAPTPGALNAPTPGAFNAPTPGAMNAPTPGGNWQGGWGAADAPTPAAGAPTPAASGSFAYAVNAPTPGAWSAETPAAGPRYEDD